jgi:hypothetical protein
MADKAKVVFSAEPISESGQWENWSWSTCEKWADLKGKVTDADRTTAKTEFLDIVKDDTKTWNDATEITATKTHNFSEWSKDMRDKLDGSAKSFCVAASAADVIKIYRCLRAQWGDPSDLEQNEAYLKLLSENFEFRGNSGKSYKDQLELWRNAMSTRLGKLVRFCPNPESREVILFQRLTNGLPPAFSEAARECRLSASIKTSAQALKYLQDKCVELQSAGKIESQTGAQTFFTQEDIDKAVKRGENKGKKAVKKQAKKNLDSFYTGGKFGGGKGKGGGKFGKGGKNQFNRGGGGGRHGNNQGPYQRPTSSGGNKYSVVYECDYCGGRGHQSKFCYKKADDEKAGKPSGGSQRFTADGRRIERR